MGVGAGYSCENKYMYVLWEVSATRLASQSTLIVRTTTQMGPLDEQSVRMYTRQILLGLVYLHSKRVVHCDIKADNVLLCLFEDKVCVALLSEKAQQRA